MIKKNNPSLYRHPIINGKASSPSSDSVLPLIVHPFSSSSSPPHANPEGPFHRPIYLLCIPKNPFEAHQIGLGSWGYILLGKLRRLHLLHLPTYRPCNSSIANSLSAYACMDTCEDPPGPNCGNNSFSFLLDNPIKAVDYRKVNGINAALVDSLALPNTQGSLVSISNFIFSCARTGFLKGLAKGVTGLAALGNSNLSIPVQINKAFPSSPNCFAMCLSGSTSQPGLVLLGSKGPYNFLQGIDLSKSLLYTPLVFNPLGRDSDPNTHRLSPEYYVGLTSIKVNGKMVALNKALLAIDGQSGSGGTRISTIVPYTKLQSSIYKAFTLAFLKEAASPVFQSYYNKAC
ncbi:hypothetical protein OIU77_006292 [Salix suchowensis]|uniref:Xylanase inhibitor N-terminal domain-containing protein n=1 Tax=Salix suchowensis TaxID=1278906 RepID=A0ABQ9AKA3_9ROSI|nr:hypothetical protein OIU77_006292 [Salix suchowensis]